MMIRISFLLSSLLLSCPLSYSNEGNAHTKFKIQAYQVSTSQTIVGVTLTPKFGWKTYWSNPGDAGMPLEMNVTQDGLTVNAQDFPAPKRSLTGGIIAYGYSTPQTFLFTIEGTLQGPLTGEATWLICNKDQCLPGAKAFDLTPETGPIPDWLTRARAAQPPALALTEPKTHQAEVVTFSFSSATDLTSYRVYPYNESFSELPAGALVTTSSAGQYSFQFDLTGPLPELNHFLISNGKSHFKLSFP